MRSCNGQSSSQQNITASTSEIQFVDCGETLLGQLGDIVRVVGSPFLALEIRLLYSRINHGEFQTYTA